MNIEDLISDVYVETGYINATEEDTEEEVQLTMEQIKMGDYTSIYSEIADNLLLEEKAANKEKWLKRLEMLVAFQRYGVKEMKKTW